jgi:hypothetical protein
MCRKNGSSSLRSFGSRTAISVLAFCTVLFVHGFGVLADTAPSEKIKVFSGTSAPRDRGAPKVETTSFTAWQGQGNFLIFNGGKTGQFSRVSSARVWINGTLVAKTSDFSQQVEILEREFSAQQTNTIQVELSGNPGSALEFDVFVDLPEGVHTLPEAEFLDVIKSHPDHGDLADLLVSYGYRFETAFIESNSGSPGRMTAAYETSSGRAVIYIVNPGWVFGLTPAALFNDGNDIILLQREVGLRISEDAWSPMNAAQVATFLSSRANSAQAYASSKANSLAGVMATSSSSAACNPFGGPNDDCIAGIEEKWKCLGIALIKTGLPAPLACPECIHALASCGLGAFSSPPAAAACAVYVTFVAGASCLECGLQLIHLAECVPELTQTVPCGTGCECVTDSTCSSVFQVTCNVNAMKAPNTPCKPDDICDAKNRKSATCNSKGLCIEGPSQPCPQSVCQTCREETGGCGPDPGRTGFLCTTSDGLPGVCNASGVCDAGPQCMCTPCHACDASGACVTVPAGSSCLTTDNNFGTCDAGGTCEVAGSSLKLIYTYPEDSGRVGGGGPNQPKAEVKYSGPSGSIPPASEVAFFIEGVSLGVEPVVFRPGSTTAFVAGSGRFTPPNVFDRPVHGQIVLRLVGSGQAIAERFVTAHTLFNPYFAFGTGRWEISGSQHHIDPSQHFDGTATITGAINASGSAECYQTAKPGSSVDVDYFGLGYTVTYPCITFGFCSDLTDHTHTLWMTDISSGSGCHQVTSPFGPYWIHFKVTNTEPFHETLESTNDAGIVIRCDRQSQLSFTAADLPSVSSSWVCTRTYPNGSLVITDSGGGTLTREQ